MGLIVGTHGHTDIFLICQHLHRLLEIISKIQLYPVFMPFPLHGFVFVWPISNTQHKTPHACILLSISLEKQSAANLFKEDSGARHSNIRSLTWPGLPAPYQQPVFPARRAAGQQEQSTQPQRDFQPGCSFCSMMLSALTRVGAKRTLLLLFPRKHGA